MQTVKEMTPFEGMQFDAITEEHLRRLVQDGVAEGRSLDYKEALSGGGDEDKKEFLADVSSFANASGGYLVFGMREEAGIAVELPGVELPDPDAVILRLEATMRDGISPRMFGTSVRVIPLASGQYALLIRVPRSWTAPHVVTFKHWSRFFSRNSAGKYQLDVHELRNAFLLSASLSERVRAFRDERLGRIVAGDTPVPLIEGMRLVLHVVQAGSADPGTIISLNIEGTSFPSDFEPMGWSGHNYRYNFDGPLCYYEGAYTQLFRNGSIEAVLLVPPRQGKLHFPITYLEDQVLKGLDRYLPGLMKRGAVPPFICLLSLLGAKDYFLPGEKFSRHYPIDRDVLICPDVLIDDFARPTASHLRPAFDALWMAVGLPHSVNYNEKGEWEPRRE